MLILEFKEGQGLGNQLWNYAVLRSLANFKNFDFGIINFEAFKGKKFIEIEKGYKKDSSNLSFKEFKEKCFYDIDFKCFVYGYDSNILNIEDNTIIEGVFQSEDYLLPNPEIIKEFINVRHENFQTLINFDKTCILNIRGGEYKMHKDLILPKTYWTNGINNIKSLYSDLEFKIITDDEEYASRLMPNYEIIKGDIANDFLHIFFAKYLILSNSSFSYFPINLGEKPKYVIAPNNWSRFDNKFNRWISPANFYSKWNWQNKKGEIIEKNKIKISVIKTYDYYNSYNVLSNAKAFKRFNFKDLVPNRLKKVLKNILHKIFPLVIG
tara:strand:+ start:377 stop:1348 length:972 start_codon:yes stop_codon:yes gene_type:complete